MRNNFNKFWKEKNIDYDYEMFEKRLSVAEIRNIRKLLEELRQKGYTFGQIVDFLRRTRKRLSEKWKAERVVATEEKRSESLSILDSSRALGAKKYRIVINPDACELCRSLTEEGTRIFEEDELYYKGHRIPPFHPFCYCLLNPIFS